MPGPLPPQDLEHVFHHTKPLWEAMRGQRLFITGGTGFFGIWLLESFAFANEKLSLGAHAVVLTRDPHAFLKKAPHLAHRADISFLAGDVRNFTFPSGKFSRVIHAATEASAKLNSEDPLLMLDTIIAGTRRALEFAAQCGAEKFLLTSSGAVYGVQPPELRLTPEEYMGGPDPVSPSSAYGEGKRAAELMCAIFPRRAGRELFQVKIARCFAFVGPGLPLDAHFAIGNFIRDAFSGADIRILGDGTPVRSYLYAADLAVWLWKILEDGAPARPYNVGSDEPATIAETAAAVCRALDVKNQITIAQKPVPGKHPARYAPVTARATKELGLRAWIGLEDGIRRTAQWHKQNQP